MTPKSSQVRFLILAMFFFHCALTIHGQPFLQDCLVGFPGSQIPDNSGETCWENSVNINNDNTDLLWQDLTPQEQALSINLEHSFMGDLIITFTCPNGSSIEVHQQGGNGTHLGIPIEGVNSYSPGIGFDYSWSPDASNGTWAMNGNGATLPSGTYESAQPWNNLEDCPVNGLWSVEVCDMWGEDNGFIFGWGTPFVQVLELSNCVVLIQGESSGASSYCTADGSISYTVDSVPADISVQLTSGAETLEWESLQPQRTFSNLPVGLYSLSFYTPEGELASYQVAIEGNISTNYNAGSDPICSASFDGDTGWNRVIWQKNDSSFIASYDVYRESNFNSEFEWIGNVPLDSLSTYLDVGFDPGSSSTRYNLVALDSCGGEVDLAGAHRTIHLQSNLGINGEVNLFWNPYEGLNYDNFSIHRSTDGTTYFPIGSVANNVYAFTDQTPPAGQKWYQIRIPLDDACEPVRSRSMSSIESNKINTLSINNVEATATQSIQLIRQSNGWILDWARVQDGTVEIVDIMGRIVYTRALGDTEGQLTLTPPATGTYLLRVSTPISGAWVKRIVN